MTQFVWMIAAGGGTTLGALALVVWRTPSDRAFDLALAASAGIMLAATVIGLLPAAQASGTLFEVVSGVALGALVIAAADRLIPHLHARFTEGVPERDYAFVDDVEGPVPVGQLDDEDRRGILLTAAVALHNFPEGMAVGIAFAAGGDLGVALAIAVLVHNIPEGLAVGLPLRSAGLSLRRILGWTVLTGVAEIVGALLGYALGDLLAGILPFGLAFAAGAMLYVVIDELVPAAHSRGDQRSSLSFLAAFCVMALIMGLLGDFQKPF